jgi:hypothetical protein
MTNRANHPGTFTEKFKSGRRHPLYRSTVLTDDESDTTDSASDNTLSSNDGSLSFTSPGSLYERRWYILRYKCVMFLGHGGQVAVTKKHVLPEPRTDNRSDSYPKQ